MKIHSLSKNNQIKLSNYLFNYKIIYPKEFSIFFVSYYLNKLLPWRFLFYKFFSIFFLIFKKMNYKFKVLKLKQNSNSK